jgi:hypothetical protein
MYAGCRLGGVVVSVLDTGHKVAGSNPTKEMDFKGDKNQKHSFPSGGN